MNLKKHTVETLTLVVVAVACALVSNAMARSERRLKLPGDYPNALAVPAGSAPTAAGAAGRAADAAGSAPTAAPEAPAPGGAAAPGATPMQAAGSTGATPSGPTPSGSASPAPAAAAPVKPAPPDLSRFAPHKDKPYVELSGDDVALLHAGGALFIDARRSAAYREGHVAGARGMSPWEADVDDKVTALVNEGRDMLAPIVVYCTGGDCEDSHMLSQKLWGVGFENVYVYKDGWPDWQRRRGPVKAGAE